MDTSKTSAGPSTPFQVDVGLQEGTPLPLDMTLSASPDRSSTRADSLSPASSSNSSITDLTSRLGPSSASAAAIQAAKDADAKSSALKALAGIGKVVSRSRQVDAEALQAIKLQRAKVKAEGSVGNHRHTRTLSTESLPSLPELTGTSLPSNLPATGGANTTSGGGGFSTSTSSSMMPPPPSRAHRRSHSGIALSGDGNSSGGAGPGHHHPAGSGNGSQPASSSQVQGSGAMLSQTSPQSYSELLSGLGLADLLALQSAVDHEIQTQLSASGLNSLTMEIGASPTGSLSPQAPADALLSAQYASAMLGSQQQQHQQTQYTGSLGHSPFYGTSPKNGIPPFLSLGNGGGIGSLPQDHDDHHAPRSHSTDALPEQRRSSSPLTPDSESGVPLASSALSLGCNEGAGGFHMDLTGMEDFVGGPQPPPTARSLDVGAPQPPREPISAAFSSTDFSFLGASGSSLLVPPEDNVTPSPFTISSSGSLGQQTLIQKHDFEQNAASEQQQQQQLPTLFGNLQLGSLDPWR